MKTIIAYSYGKGFYTVLLVAVWMGIFLTHVTLATSLTGTATKTGANSPSPDEFMANSYYLPNSFGLVVRLVNPEQKPVNIRIVNRQGNVVFRKSLGTPSVYATIFNVKDLPNGDYTLIIQSVGYKYSKDFSLHTESKRVIKTFEPDSDSTKQEAM